MPRSQSIRIIKPSSPFSHIGKSQRMMSGLGACHLRINLSDLSEHPKTYSIFSFDQELWRIDCEGDDEQEQEQERGQRDIYCSLVLGRVKKKVEPLPAS